MTNLVTPTNGILGRLPPTIYKRLQPHLQPVTLGFKQVLYGYQAPIDYVYFLNSGAASTITVMDDGSTIEIAAIGKEGVVGLSVLLSVKTSPNEVFMQIAGDGLRISADVLKREAAAEGPLRELLLRYHTYFLTQVSQLAACNGLHPIQKRCCRWLLTTQDSLGVNVVPLTHEFLALMLGVRRPSVTEVLGPLQAQGLLHNSRGAITIIDRPGLELLACECYQTVRNEYAWMLGPM